MPKFDVVTTIHSKDINRYIKYLKYNKKYLQESDKFYYISANPFECDSIYIDENKYSFSKEEFIDYIKNYIPDYR